MKNLIIKRHTDKVSDTTPDINFNAENGICEIYGQSFMDNAVEFFHPVLKWIVAYIENIAKPLNVIIKLKYYNTGTSRSIFTMLEYLKEFEDKGGVVNVEWHFSKNDIDTEEDIIDLGEESEMDIKLVKI